MMHECLIFELFRLHTCFISLVMELILEQTSQGQSTGIPSFPMISILTGIMVGISFIIISKRKCII
jgi:hypothetical protein